ncbi:hypothetical protein [uncultured Cobetia sp.]|uniref:hypothetical protein n=1 Tax=uncultured Cobetia sp. TaxID=410706 RepID=UPI0030EC040B
MSFDDFKRYNSSSSKPTVSVVIKYSFSILPPKGNSPQEYVVTIRFNSRVAMLNAIEKEAPAFMRGRIIRMVTYHTSEISVEYTDYVVAKSFLDTFNEWIEGCNTHPRNRCVEIAQSYSHFLPLVIKMIVVALFVTSGIKAIPLLTAGASLEELAKSALILSTGFYVLVLLAGVVGKWTESSIDNIHQLSYLKINKGDAKLIENFSDRNRTSLYKFVIGAFFSFGLSVMASKLSMLI